MTQSRIFPQLVFVVIALCVSAVSAASDTNLDIVIKGGRVVDGLERLVGFCGGLTRVIIGDLIADHADVRAAVWRALVRGVAGDSNAESVLHIYDDAGRPSMACLSHMLGLTPAAATDSRARRQGWS